MKHVALADDLTGAIEVAAFFARAGLRSLVSVDPVIPQPFGNSSAALLVINTDSRHLAEKEARERVAQLMLEGVKLGFQAVFKKTDSTLRGNIGAEISAALEAWPGGGLVFVPAYPRLGRVCQGGHLYVDGKPLGQTGFASDPRSPVRDGYTPNLFEGRLPTHIEVLPRAADFELILKDAPDGAAFICDAETQDDLRRIAQAIHQNGSRYLSAGPAGIVEYLADLIGGGAQPPPRPDAQRWLCACGSLNDVSLGQVEFARSQGQPVFDLDPQRLLDTPAEEISTRIVGLMEEHGRLIVATTRRGVDGPIAHGSPSSTRPNQDDLPARINDAFGRVVSRAAARSKPDALIVFGGDSSHAILRCSGCDVLESVGEALPGTPISVAEIEERRIWLITKSGGYGPPDVIERICSAFEPRQKPEQR
jgi:uncharacterized protein YgbK (DUF1537 family)